MTDRRERIARAIRLNAIHEFAGGVVTCRASETVDAILAALADELLPGVSPAVTSIHLFQDEDGWTCNIEDESADVDVWSQNSPSIPAAIRNALEGATDE